ncbi:hypothetical protein ANRL3_00129 [Anaerolineae bacterium]|nr:hypothetical protein ANRL3_00129 [Anaerolineae bacterium]
MLLLVTLVAACNPQSDRLAPSSPAPAMPPSVATPSPTTTATPLAAASNASPNSAAKTASVEQGQIAFFKNCFECHDDNGKGVPGIFTRYQKLSKPYIVKLVREGLQVDCCLFMSPNGQVSDEELDAIVEYLRSVQPETFADFAQ